jgi:hypothetical protein
VVNLEANGCEWMIKIPFQDSGRVVES